MKIKASTQNVAIALLIAITGALVISACGTTAGESYDNGYRLGTYLRTGSDPGRGSSGY